MAVKTTNDNTYNQVARKGNKLSQLVGESRKIIGDEVATRRLDTKEAGALCLFDVASGTTYTLPTIDRVEQIGMTFEFLATTIQTSGANKVVTPLASEFLVGSVMIGDKTVANSGDVFDANGTTHRGISMNATTTGGLLGSRFVVTAISLTQWAINGLLQGAGVTLDPFTTS